MAINLGDINFGLGTDTRRLDQARQAILQFGRAVNTAARDQTDGARAAESALRRQEKAILSALQQTLKLNSAIRSSTNNDGLIQSTTNTFNRLVKELGKGQVSALQFQRSMEDFQASTGRVTRSLNQQKSELAATAKAQADLEKAAAQAARVLEKSASQEARLAFDGARAQEQSILKRNAAWAAAEQAVLRYNATVTKSSVADQGGYFNRAQEALERYRQALNTAGNSAIKFQEAQNTFKKSMAEASIALSQETQALARTTKAEQDLERATNSAAKAQTKASQDSVKLAFEAARAQEQSILRTEKAYFAAAAAVDRFNAAVSRVKNAPASLTERATAAQSTFQTSFGAAGGSTIMQQRSTQEFKKAMAELNAELTTFKKKASDAANSSLYDAMRRLADVSVLLQGPMSGLATRLTLISGLADRVSIGMAALVTGVSAGVFAFFNIAGASIKAADAIYKIDQALSGLINSSTLSATEMNYLMKTADRAGAQFEDVSRQYIRLTAAAKGTNLEGEATRVIFENLLFATQKLGSSNDELSGVLRAVEQIMSKGKVQAEELRGQLGDRLPGAIQIMASALGVSTQKLDEMMKKGELTSDVLLKFATEVSKRFGADTTKAIDAVTASENRLHNSLLRFNKSVDESISFSTAYKNALETTASVLDFFGKNVDNAVRIIGAAAGAIVGTLAAIYGPAVLSGFMAIITMVRTLTTVIWGMTAAVIANPFGALASIIIRVGLAAAGAVAGFELMNKAIGETNQAHFGALPGVKAYISAQQEMKSSIRATTEEYIKQQQVMLQGIQNRVTQLQKLVGNEQDQFWSDAAPGIPRFMGNMIGQDQALASSAKRLADYKAELERLGIQEKDAAKDLEALNQILDKQTTAENKRSDAIKKGGSEIEGSMNRAQLAIKNANDTIRETEQQLAIFRMPKPLQEWAQIQLDINKQVENFRDQLLRAKIPAAEVAVLTDRFGTALRALKEGQYNIQNIKTVFETLATTLSSGLDNAMTSFVDGIIEGKNELEILSDVGKRVAADLIKSFVQLGAINPLKNMLFGGDYSTGKPFPTLSFGGLFGLDSQQGTSAGGTAAAATTSSTALQGLGTTATQVATQLGSFGTALQTASTSVAGQNNALTLASQQTVQGSQQFATATTTAATSATQASAGFGNMFNSLIGGISSIATTFLSGFGSVLTAIISALSSMIGGIGSGLTGIFKIFGFKDGGYTGGGKNDVRGVVHGQEFVVNAQATSKPGIRDMLEKLNSGESIMSQMSNVVSLREYSKNAADGLRKVGMSNANGRQRFRQGQVFSTPTNVAPLMGGDGGSEALMPLTRNSQGQLAVQTSGGSRPITVNIMTPNPEAFKKSEVQVSEAIVRASQRGMRNF